MKKLITIIFMCMILFITSCTNFEQTVTFKDGIKFSENGAVQRTPYLGGTTGDVYWDNILNKPSMFPPEAHNHNGLYKPISYIPTWAEILNKPTFADVAFSGDYNDLVNKPSGISADWDYITNKPTIFPSSWGIIVNKPETFPPAAHNHDGAYKPNTYVPTWAEILNKPATYTPSTHGHAYGEITGTPDLDAVATSGNYNDLHNIPTTFPPASHNHDASYKSLSYIPTWGEITSKPTTYPSDWSVVANKPTTFPPAAHNHDANYKPLSYVPAWTEVTGKPATYPPATHNHDGVYKPNAYVPAWAEILNKPSIYASDWSVVANKPTTYPPATHTHTFAEITDKPQEVELQQAMELLDYTPPVQKTTTEINAMVMPTGKVGFVFDKTTSQLKFWNGTAWKTVTLN